MTDRDLAGCGLLPCPFCGNDDVGNDEGCFPVSKGYWEVRCGNPSCYAHEPSGATRDEAIERWNRRAPSSEGDGIPQVEGLTVEREAGALSQSGERFPDLFVIRLGDREDCVIKGEQPALWAMFDAAIAAAERENHG